jgi:NADP-dependent 3-hydroxy acid dehydrogenase YdfG
VPPGSPSFKAELLSFLEVSPAERELRGLSAFVTGCSSGIGLAVTLDLLRLGVNVTGVARREDRLKAIQEMTREKKLTGSFEYFAADCSNQDFIETVRSKPHWLKSEILICNAGLAKGLDPVSKASLNDWNEMISTNVTAVFALISTFLPHMIQAGQGNIIGLGSIAGHVSYENGSVYCATKHALRAFFTALRQETCGQNIRASLVSPGMVKTEFSQVRFHGDTERAKSVYAGVNALTAQDISRIILQVLKQPTHVNIDDIIVMPVQQGAPHKVARHS